MPRQRHGLAAAAFVAGLLALSAEGAAQSNADAYQDAINRALEEYNLGHWTEAKVFFRQAHALKPSARTLRGLGLASYESRNYVEALEYLQQAIASSVQPLTPQMRAATVDLIDLARQFVMRAEVELEPAEAELRVDGKPTRLAADGTILLDPGEHELTVLAPGFEPLRRRVNTEGGRQTRLHLVLTPRPLPRPAPELSEPQPIAAARSPAADSGESGDSIAPWLVVGGSGVLAASGAVVLGLGLSAKSEVENADDGASWPEAKSANRRAVPMQVAGGIMLGVGLAGVAAGLAWELWPGEHRDGLAVRATGYGLDLTQRF